MGGRASKQKEKNGAARKKGKKTRRETAEESRTEPLKEICDKKEQRESLVGSNESCTGDVPQATTSEDRSHDMTIHCSFSVKVGTWTSPRQCIVQGNRVFFQAATCYPCSICKTREATLDAGLASTGNLGAVQKADVEGLLYYVLTLPEGFEGIADAKRIAQHLHSTFRVTMSVVAISKDPAFVVPRVFLYSNRSQQEPNRSMQTTADEGQSSATATKSPLPQPKEEETNPADDSLAAPSQTADTSGLSNNTTCSFSVQVAAWGSPRQCVVKDHHVYFQAATCYPCGICKSREAALDKGLARSSKQGIAQKTHVDRLLYYILPLPQDDPSFLSDAAAVAKFMEEAFQVTMQVLVASSVPGFVIPRVQLNGSNDYMSSSPSKNSSNDSKANEGNANVSSPSDPPPMPVAETTDATPTKANAVAEILNKGSSDSLASTLALLAVQLNSAQRTTSELATAVGPAQQEAKALGLEKEYLRLHAAIQQLKILCVDDTPTKFPSRKGPAAVFSFGLLQKLLSPVAEAQHLLDVAEQVEWDPMGEHVVVVSGNGQAPCHETGVELCSDTSDLASDAKHQGHAVKVHLRCARMVDKKDIQPLSYRWDFVKGSALEWSGEKQLQCADCDFSSGVRASAGGLNPYVLPDGIYWIDHLCVQPMPQGLTSIYKSAALYRGGARLKICTRKQLQPGLERTRVHIDHLCNGLERTIADLSKKQQSNPVFYGASRNAYTQSMGVHVEDNIFATNPDCKSERGWIVWEDASCIGTNLLLVDGEESPEASHDDNDRALAEAVEKRPWFTRVNAPSHSVLSALAHASPSTACFLIHQCCFGRQHALNELVGGVLRAGNMYDVMDIVLASHKHAIVDVGEEALASHYKSNLLATIPEKHFSGLSAYPPLTALPEEAHWLLKRALQPNHPQGRFLSFGETKHVNGPLWWKALNMSPVKLATLAIRASLDVCLSLCKLAGGSFTDGVSFEVGMRDESTLVMATAYTSPPSSMYLIPCTISIDAESSKGAFSLGPIEITKPHPANSLAGCLIGLSEPETDLSVSGRNPMFSTLYSAVYATVDPPLLGRVQPFTVLAEHPDLSFSSS